MGEQVTVREPRPAGTDSPGEGQVAAGVGHVEALGQFARMASSRDVTVESLLSELCDVATRALAVQGAGVMLLDGSRLAFIDAQPAHVVPIQRLQEELQRGPCCDSISTQEAVVVDAVTFGHRWPELATTAEAADVRAVASVPLLAQGRCWGVLDLYRSTPRPWTESELAIAALCADVATSYIVLAAERARWRDACREMEDASTHDALTGLPTRRLLFDRLEHAVLLGARHRTAVAVLFLDVDDFQSINDTLGPATGDLVLAEIARRLSRLLRANDTLARLSGDEFVVVCEDLVGTPRQIRTRLGALARRIQRDLRRSPGPGEVEVRVSVSIGAVVTSHPRSARDLIADADLAMYQAKQQGGGQLVFGDEGGLPLVSGRPGRARLNGR